jgi:hypothetical protein
MWQRMDTTTRSAREPLSYEGQGPARGRAQALGTRHSSLLVGRSKPGSIRLLRLLLAACALIEGVLTFRVHPVAPTAAAPAASGLCGLSVSLSFVPRRAVSHLLVDSLDSSADDASICRTVRAAPDALTRASPSAWSPRPSEASASPGVRGPAHTHLCHRHGTGAVAAVDNRGTCLGGPLLSLRGGAPRKAAAPGRGHTAASMMASGPADADAPDAVSIGASKKGDFTEEDAQLMRIVSEIGPKWTEVSTRLGGSRSAASCKSRYARLLASPHWPSSQPRSPVPAPPARPASPQPRQQSWAWTGTEAEAPRPSQPASGLAGPPAGVSDGRESTAGRSSKRVRRAAVAGEGEGEREGVGGGDGREAGGGVMGEGERERGGGEGGEWGKGDARNKMPRLARPEGEGETARGGEGGGDGRGGSQNVEGEQKTGGKSPPARRGGKEISMHDVDLPPGARYVL